MTYEDLRLDVTPTEVGLRLGLHVTPAAKRNFVGGLHGTALRVYVSDAPEKGKANRAVLELLAKTLRLRKSQCELVSGETSRCKTVLITGLSIDEFNERIRPIALNPKP